MVCDRSYSLWYLLAGADNPRRKKSKWLVPSSTYSQHNLTSAAIRISTQLSHTATPHIASHGYRCSLKLGCSYIICICTIWCHPSKRPSLQITIYLSWKLKWIASVPISSDHLLTDNTWTTYLLSSSASNDVMFSFRSALWVVVQGWSLPTISYEEFHSNPTRGVKVSLTNKARWKVSNPGQQLMSYYSFSETQIALQSVQAARSRMRNHWW